MKSIKEFIFEDAANESKLGKKFDNIFKKNQNKLTRIIQSRQEHWDVNKTDWAREPMFLIAGPKGEMNIGSARDYSWVRWKHMKGNKGEIKGTFKNYNIADENNEKPNSVIGIYYDRHFELITSMEVFNQLYDVLDNEYEKYYNNLYEHQINEWGNNIEDAEKAADEVFDKIGDKPISFKDLEKELNNVGWSDLAEDSDFELLAWGNFTNNAEGDDVVLHINVEQSGNKYKIVGYQVDEE